MKQFAESCVGSCKKLSESCSKPQHPLYYFKKICQKDFNFPMR